MESALNSLAGLDLTNGGATPEKLAIMKLRGDIDRSDVFSDPGTPTGAGLRSSVLERSGTSRSLARSSSRQITKSSRRSTSFISAHRNKMSSELTAQAETKFFSLMELMSNASREASSLKEFWARIIAEREAYAQEREELLEQVTEMTTELEQRTNERQKNTIDAAERRRHIEKVLAELAAALAAVALYKKHVHDRDQELEKIRKEIVDLRDGHTRGRGDYDRVAAELELIRITLKTAESDRDNFRAEVDVQKKDLQRLHRERTEMSSKLTDIISRHDSARKEVLTLTDRIKLYESEHDESIHEIERLKEDARKAKIRAEDAAKEVLEITERLERTSREIVKLKETIRITEAERDEHAHTLEHLRREIKTIGVSRDELEEKYSDVNLKYEHVKREVLSVREKLRNVELESKDYSDRFERGREQYRLIVIERDELKDEVLSANRRTEDVHRQITALTDNLRRAESTLAEFRSENSILNDRIKHVEVERDDHHGKHKTSIAEVIALTEGMALLKGEITKITEHRDRLRGDLDRRNREFEQVTEEYTYGDDSHELEFEIESLRGLLRDARDQKERAISARNTADRERDEAVSKYEEKCRELERYEEQASSHYHAHSERRGGGSRMVSRSSTTINHGHSSSGGHGMSGLAHISSSHDD